MCSRRKKPRWPSPRRRTAPYDAGVRTPAIAWALILVGVVLALVSGLGDAVGVGAQEGTFGWKQIAGLAVGLAVAATGVGLLLRPKVDAVADDGDPGRPLP